MVNESNKMQGGLGLSDQWHRNKNRGEGDCLEEEEEETGFSTSTSTRTLSTFCRDAEGNNAQSALNTQWGGLEIG